MYIESRCSIKVIDTSETMWVFWISQSQGTFYGTPVCILLSLLLLLLVVVV